MVISIAHETFCENRSKQLPISPLWETISECNFADIELTDALQTESQSGYAKDLESFATRALRRRGCRRDVDHSNHTSKRRLSSDPCDQYGFENIPTLMALNLPIPNFRFPGRASPRFRARKARIAGGMTQRKTPAGRSGVRSGGKWLYVLAISARRLRSG